MICVPSEDSDQPAHSQSNQSLLALLESRLLQAGFELFNDLPTFLGHFVSSLKEWEKREAELTEKRKQSSREEWKKEHSLIWFNAACISHKVYFLMLQFISYATYGITAFKSLEEVYWQFHGWKFCFMVKHQWSCKMYNVICDCKTNDLPPHMTV